MEKCKEAPFLISVGKELTDERFAQVKTLLDKVNLPEYGYVEKVVQRLFESYKVALKVLYSRENEKLVFSRYEAIESIVASEAYIKTSSIHLPNNPVRGRIKDYPVTALLTEEFTHTLSQNNKDLLLLLTFVLVELLLDSEDRFNHANDLLISNASNTIRKAISGQQALKAKVSLSNFEATKIPLLILELSDKTNLKFQKQFVSLVADNPIFSVNVGPSLIDGETNTSSASQSKFRKNGRLATPIFEQTVDRFEIKPSSENSSEYIDYAELTELKPTTDLDLDHRTKSATLLYGSRLTLQERQQLPWRTIALADFEAENLFNFLEYSLCTRDEDKIAAVIYLSAVTSTSIDDVCQMLVSPSESPETGRWGINLEIGCLRRASVIMPSAYSVKDRTPLLRKHQLYLDLPLPLSLITYLRSYDLNGSVELAKFIGLKNSVSDDVNRFLKNFRLDSSLVSRNITKASIRNFLFEKISHMYDSAVASLILANTEFAIPTSLYYLSMDGDKAKRIYVEALKQIKLQEIEIQKQESKVIGSQLSIEPQKFSEFINEKHSQLCVSKLSTTEGAIQLFNNLACYTTLLMLAATGHRDKSQYGFVPFVINEEEDLITLSDKVNFVDSAIRIIPLAKLVKAQLIEYRKWALLVAKKISLTNTELANKIYSATQFRVSESPTLFLINDNDLNPIGSAEIQTYLSPEITLPPNFLRHYFCSYLRSMGIDHVKSLTGHISSGEHLLSDHSCASLLDISFIAEHIDSLLNSLGFKVATCPKSSRGVGQLIQLPSSKFYIPDYLQRSEDKELNNHIKWARQLVKPFIADLTNESTYETTRSEIIQVAINDKLTGISPGRRLITINRFIDKLIKGHKWVGFTHDFSGLNISVNTLCDLGFAKTIRKCINELLISQKKIPNNLKIILSLAVNSGQKVIFNTENINKICSSPYIAEDLVWYELENSKTKRDRVYVDSLTHLHMQRTNLRFEPLHQRTADALYRDLILNKIKVEGELPKYVIQKIKAITDLNAFLLQARSAGTSALSHAFANNRLDTTNLSQQILVRWFSGKNFPSGDNLESSDEQQGINFNKLIISNKTNLKDTQLILRKLNRFLSNLQHDHTIQQVGKATPHLMRFWASEVNLIEGNHKLEKLIENSFHLAPIGILILIWLIDVSKRKGKGRKWITIKTLKTYLSNIANPLLEQAQCTPFTELSQSEIEEIYSDALDSREIERRESRARLIRDFHTTLQSHFYLPDIDWLYVEPNIFQYENNVNANIISMNEYKKSLFLLRTDKCYSDDGKRVNMLILMLCYRAGLRSGEASHLRLNDIDTDNWVIYVRSSNYYRLKTRASNRRVPVNLLLSDEEKSLLKEQINYIKALYPEYSNVWLFADRAHHKCLKYLRGNLTRIIEALKLATGDQNIKLHHARHSFANYLLLAMHESSYPSVINNELTAWCRTTALISFSRSLRQCFVGLKETRSHILAAISLSLGHSTPETTIKHYLHVIDLINYSDNEKNLYIETRAAAIIKLSSIERTRCYKLIERGSGKFRSYQPILAAQMTRKEKYIYFETPCRQKEQTLSNIKTNESRQLLVQFYDIERILRATECQLAGVDIAQRLGLSYRFVEAVIDKAYSALYETGYKGFNVPERDLGIIFSLNPKISRKTAGYLCNSKYHEFLQASLGKWFINREKLKSLNFFARSLFKINILINKANQKKFDEEIKSLGVRSQIINTRMIKRNYGCEECIELKLLHPTVNSQMLIHSIYVASILAEVREKIIPMN